MPETTTAVLVITPENMSPQARYRLRMEESRARMNLAMRAVRDRARELTPAARIKADPVKWILGGVLVGFVFGLLMGPRRRERSGDLFVNFPLPTKKWSRDA